MDVLTTAVLATASTLISTTLIVYVAGVALAAAVVFPSLAAERFADRAGYTAAGNDLYAATGLTLVQAGAILTVLWPWVAVVWARNASRAPVGSPRLGTSDAHRRSHR